MELEASYAQDNGRLTYTCRKIFSQEQWKIVNTYLLDLLEDYRPLFPSPPSPEVDMQSGEQDEHFSYDGYNRVVLGDTRDFSGCPKPEPKMKQTLLSFVP